MKEGVFSLLVDSAAQNAISMRQRDLEGAFLTPVDYARDSSEYCIVPGVAVSSRTPNDTIVLHFKPGLQSINTIAVHPTSTSEIVLASILMSERFGVRPTIIPVIGSFDQMLEAADAALLVGNDALDQRDEHRNKLDLVEEWMDLTGFPYVHGFWCTRASDLTLDDVAELRRARAHGAESLDRIARSDAPKHPRESAEGLRQYLESLSLTFTDEEQEALSEFLRYAYYHGSLPDVAELNFYSAADEDDIPFFGPSLN
jgi:chorismate dehydratase